MNKFASIQVAVGAHVNSAHSVLAWQDMLGSVLWAVLNIITAIINTVGAIVNALIDYGCIVVLLDVCTSILIVQIRKLFNSDHGIAFQMIQGVLLW